MTPEFITTAEKVYPQQITHFKQLIATNQLSHLYLFVGPSQPEKLAFSRYLAWLMAGADERQAIRIMADDHPDVKITQPSLPKSGTGTKRTWKVDQIRALKPEFVTVAQESQRKVFVFDAIETLQAESGNALLKFIEEPAGPQLMIMLAENLNEVLPTIRSRAQIVQLRPEIALAQPDDEAEQWRKTMQPVLFKWFELMMQRRVEAFVYVQLQLVDALKEAPQQRLFLAWLHELSRDTVVYGQIPDAQLHFPTLVGLYKTLRQHYSPQQLVRASDVIFADDRLSQTNVSLQTRFEKMVLEIAMALGE
ncbi:MAG: DNA polymerase III subunit delta [Leuconostoc lactis]|uniref:DNA polymerase III subunit delta n=2 Tax=Leuconostoc lactis TaxID=1246 RepID=UPI000BAB4723|nr:DNA polymerase III subunit delta [Leuconostoc lactis]MBU7537212.1 DNA polymerase III subunit delta [Leuconostoc lactis]MDI6495792.1 DNA polymerase III subunit delta [Leuconostoc lactis]MDI6573106.1 DNA polymerase III subunit delta [Leuconostoc lactis]MSB66679.1 DNA polymerase III subunit delta [Leuconostoc lactis]PAV33048.1 DNA polymerase III subunit delta [Leuconostoc lactis]